MQQNDTEPRSGVLDVTSGCWRAEESRSQTLLTPQNCQNHHVHQGETLAASRNVCTNSTKRNLARSQQSGHLRFDQAVRERLPRLAEPEAPPKIRCRLMRAMGQPSDPSKSKRPAPGALRKSWLQRIETARTEIAMVLWCPA